MRPVGLTLDEAVYALDVLHRHAPVDALPPRFVIAVNVSDEQEPGVLFADGDGRETWWSYADRGTRLVQNDQDAEVTTFIDGDQVSHTVSPIRPDRQE